MIRVLGSKNKAKIKELERAAGRFYSKYEVDPSFQEKISQQLGEKELGEAIMELMVEDLREGKDAVSLFTEEQINRPDFTERSLTQVLGDTENRWI